MSSREAGWLDIQIPFLKSQIYLKGHGKAIQFDLRSVTKVKQK